ncbi:MAG TPA: YbjN domain-containing protein [Kofleriaceae bacterium]|nr:YbjN domain-containing protein [Kofleriaceae bacterium]
MADSTRFTLSFENLKAWCQRNRYGFSEDAKRGHLAVHQELLGQAVPIMMLPQLDRNMLVMVMRQPFDVPRERQAAILDACALLNATSFMGAWALNREFGELYFRVTLPVVDIQYTDAGVLYAAQIVLGTSERAAPAMRAIALEGADPFATLSKVIKAAEAETAAAAAAAAATPTPDAPTK